MNQHTSEAPVLFDIADGVATITLNRPGALNAMTNGLMKGIHDACDQVCADESVRVVVLTGNGRGFCAGADLVQVASTPSETDSNAASTGSSYFLPAMRALKACPVPTVARVHGPAAGGGFGLALACDITIASKSAFFVATFSPRLGIVPDLGVTWSLPTRAGRARAMGLCLMGNRLPAETAAEWGLIWSCVEDDQLDEEIGKVVSLLKRSSPETVTRVRQSIDAAQHNTFSKQLDLEMAHQDVLIPRNLAEGAAAFVEKRDPVFGGERG